MNNWTGAVYTNNAGVANCCVGGPAPAFNTETNTIRFSWGYSAVAQSIAINKALETLGNGLKISGYNYSWKINNSEFNSGPLTGAVSLVSPKGYVLESYTYDYNKNIPDFQTFSGTQKFTTDYTLQNVSSLDVVFVGSDNRFWAGYYGPRVRDVSISLNYTTQPPAPQPPAQQVVSEVLVDAAVTVPETVSTSTTVPTPPEQKTQTTTAAQAVAARNRRDAKTAENEAVQRVQDQAAAETRLVQQVLTNNQTSAVTSVRVTETVTVAPRVVSNTVLPQTHDSTGSTHQAQSGMQQRHGVAPADQTPPTLILTTNSRTDPVKAFTEPSGFVEPVAQDTTTKSSVNAPKDNELAGTASISSIAVVPKGYSAYTSVQLTDAKFYSVKPLYPDQRVIDNVQVLRGLGSDIRHQQMVRDQYK